MTMLNRPRLRRTFRPRLESLEDRLAPAVVVNPTTVTFRDVDGDRVTVKVSTGTLDATNFVFSTPFADTGAQQLQTLVLNAAEFQGASVSVIAVRDPVQGGDGFANVGRVDATGVDLAALAVDGDLGQVDAGDAATSTPGLGTLTVQSIGRFGTTTQAAGGDLNSAIAGSLTALTVKSDVVGAAIVVSAGTPADGKIGKITIGGSLIGPTAAAGQIAATGDIGPVAIKGNLEGFAVGAGRVVTSGKMGTVTVGGSLNGGSAASTADMGLVKVAGSVLGAAAATATDSGSIVSQSGKIAGVTIGGSVRGSAAAGSGRVSASGDLGLVKVAGSLVGGNGTGSGQVVSVTGKLAGLSLGGSLAGGGATDTALIKSAGDMGPVTVRGDLRGRGNDRTALITAGGRLASVTVGGSLVGGGGNDSGSIESTLDMGAVKVVGDLRGGGGNRSAQVSAGAGLLGVTVGGSLVGGGGNDSAAIETNGGDLGPVKVGGELRGGGGNTSGSIHASGKLAGAAIGGAVTGGGGIGSGQVFGSSDVGPVTILGDLRGANGVQSGSVFGLANIASVTVTGSVVGGTADNSGWIRSNNSLGPVKVTGDLVGGSVNGANLNDSGFVTGKRIASVTLGGNLIAGTRGAADVLTHSGAIRADDDLGLVVVKGSLIGNALNPVVISGRGVATPGTTDVAIKGLTVGNRVEFANVLAGYDVTGTAINADAQIGAVTVGTDWIASNLVAGAVAGADGKFGTADDVPIPEAAQDPAITARIASVLIRGQALGTPGGTDGFGFVAQLIGSLKVGGTTIPLTAGASNDTTPIPVGATADLFAREV